MTDETDINISAEDPPNSVMESLRRRHKAISDNVTLDEDVPGYDGELFARYRLLDGRTLVQIGERVQKTERDQLRRGILAAADVLIASCEGFYVRDNGVEKGLHELIGEELPVKYDVRLADFLRFTDELPETPTARSVAFALFCNRDMALGLHSSRVQRWMSGLSQEVDEELLGGL